MFRIIWNSTWRVVEFVAAFCFGFYVLAINGFSIKGAENWINSRIRREAERGKSDDQDRISGY